MNHPSRRHLCDDVDEDEDAEEADDQEEEQDPAGTVRSKTAGK